MLILGNHEVEVLKRFFSGKVVEKKEEFIVNEFRGIGWPSIKVEPERNKDRLVSSKTTTKLTPLGRDFVKLELILRSPWKRFLFKLINLPVQ